MKISISELMRESGVGFGTSGARGLVEAMTDRVCYAYTQAFICYLESTGEISPGSEVAVAGDYRPSTPKIMSACVRAVKDSGYLPVNCGFIPSPAVALFGIEHKIPSLMVTGSHIPDDRNGIKFNKTTGEILKADEEGIRAGSVDILDGLFDAEGGFLVTEALPEKNHAAYQLYLNRYVNFFQSDALNGLRVGLYEHSSVAREIFGQILEALGAEVIHLGRSDQFIPVDTEAVRSEDKQLALLWAKEHNLDCIVSTDGDGDRPLVSNEKGQWLRGDVAGILCAEYLGAKTIVTPVSSNTAVEKSGIFNNVQRTRIGSPFVIAVMDEMIEQGEKGVIGYEANGGFLQADRLEKQGRVLDPLPTRDAIIVALSILAKSTFDSKPISALVRDLPPRYTCSDRLKAFPTELSQQRIKKFIQGDFDENCQHIEAVWGDLFGRVKSIDQTDGLRITFQNEEIVHLRPSGNAPEFRCYTEADTDQRAEEMLGLCLEVMEGWRKED